MEKRGLWSQIHPPVYVPGEMSSSWVGLAEQPTRVIPKTPCRTGRFPNRPATVFAFFYPEYQLFCPFARNPALTLKISFVLVNTQVVLPDVEICALAVTSRHPCSKTSRRQVSAQMGKRPVDLRLGEK